MPNNELFTSYSGMVEMLAKDGQEILNSLDAEKCHLLHMAIGINGECSELFEVVNLSLSDSREWFIEELGDIEFYSEGLRGALLIKRTLPATPPLPDVPLYRKSNLMKPAGDLVVHGGEILDTIKKYVIYEKELDRERLKNLFINFERAFSEFAWFLREVPEGIRKANMEKLSVRYNSGTYSNKHAQEREDKKNEE